MSKSQQAAIKAANRALAGTGIAPIALPSTNGSSKRRSKTTVKPVVATVDAPFGFKADGTPRKRPVPTWLNNVKSDVTPKEKKNVKKNAPKVKVSKPAAPKAVRVERNEREQDSVTATMIRGKRDWKTRAIDTDWMPAKDGGVRFEEERDNGRSPHFMSQADFADLGSPEKIRVTVKALA